MKHLSLLMALITVVFTAFAEESPREVAFMEVSQPGGHVDTLPLLLTSVDTRISGFIADVRVTQVYKNDGDTPLEATYVFPKSENTALYKMEMRIGDRKIVAEVQEKSRARETYANAKAENKTTTLLEQRSNNQLRMKLGNIQPGDDIEISLRYVETLIPRDGVYTFEYPVAFTPSTLDKTRVNKAIRQVDQQQTGFDIIVQLDAGMPIVNLESPSHDIEIDAISDNRAAVVLADSELFTENRSNFQLQYRLSGNQIASGLLTHQEGDDGYFLLMAQPPQRPASTDITDREYVFIVDVSGSMTGFPLQTAVQLMDELLEGLSVDDVFNVVLFAGKSNTLFPHSLPATPERIRQAKQLLQHQVGGGGTRLISALKTVNQTPLQQGRSRSVIAITDGYIHVGQETMKYIRAHLGQTNLFTLGVGNSIDRVAIKKLAKAGMGEPFILSKPDAAAELVQALKTYIEAPVLTDIDLYFDQTKTFDHEPPHIPDLFAQRPVFVVGRFNGKASGDAIITGITGQRDFEARYALPSGITRTQNNPAIKYLWAQERLRWLDTQAQTEEIKAATAELGVKYNLVTSQTSFVAVDHNRISASAPQAQVRLSAPINGYGFSPISTLQALASTQQAMISKNITPDFADLTTPVKTRERRAITILLGNDQNPENPYFAAAEQYFLNQGTSQEPVTVNHARSLQEARDLLTQTAHGEPWGVVNLIVHGSPWTGLNTAVSEGDSATLFQLAEILQSDQTSPVADHVLDQYSEIRIWGCGLGNQPRLLQHISQYFGGLDAHRPRVRSPKNWINFSADAHSPHSSVFLTQPMEIVLPVRKALTRNEITEKFMAKYGAQFSPSGLSLAESLHSQPIEISIALDDPKLAKTRNALRIARSQQWLESYLSNLNVTVEDLDWDIQHHRGDNRNMLIGRGHLYHLTTQQASGRDLKPLNWDDAESITTIQ